MAASSSVHEHHRKCKYGVFLNFRGPDTRDGFVSFLYDALYRRGIRTYLDSVELEKGADVSTILDAIQDSRIAVVVFSADYASSPWCLDELVEIMECRQTTGLKVLVVFYRVNTEDVANQTGSFSEAFDQHQQSNGRETVDKWRIALKNAVSISGWDYASREIRNESALVKKIVKDILEKLRHIYFPNDLEGLVGMHSRVEEIESLLFSGKVNDVRIVGIWGMGGIGKTTLAKAVFDKYSSHFQSSCFLANVRESSEKFGLPKLQEKLLANLLNGDNKSVHKASSSSSTFLLNQLRHRKVLIVLDDVDKFKQIEYLAGKHEWFGEGSRVLITSRDRQVLKNGVDSRYEVEPLDGDEALQLFSLFAFKQSYSLADHLELSNRVLKYAKGLPLALKILGLFLHDRSKEEWQSALNELRETPNMEVQEVLKISYNGLDTSAKEIFLHIACFFRGEPKHDVERILDYFGFSTTIVLSKLADKALIVISNSNVEMHDLLQEMGREIVRQESVKEPGKRSRLWNPKDICHVLEKNTGTEAIEGISLHMNDLNVPACVVPTVFSKMDHVKLLRLDKMLDFPQGLESLPRELRYLKWRSYPLKALPSNVYFENLVELEMSSSNMERLWTGKQNLSSLRVIRVKWFSLLIEMPDFSGAPNLQIIEFESCEMLLEISSSIKYLENLMELNVSYCRKIRSVPSTKGLRSLKNLILRCCSTLEKLLEVSESIEVLDLTFTSIKEVPSCSKLRSLKKLNLSVCPNLRKFPELSTSVEELYVTGSNGLVPPSIEHLSRLQTLHLVHCTGLGHILENIGQLSSLQELDLSENSFEYIPTCIKHLSCLEKLILHNCSSLQSLPELPPHLTFLTVAYCTSLQMVTNSKFALVETLEKLPRVNFSFLNCHQLNEDARRNVSNHALQVMRIFAREAHFQLPKSDGGKEEVLFVYPGNEIPDWINLQSTGSSITVELPHNLAADKKLLGYVICALVDEEVALQTMQLPTMNFFCECHVESDDARRNLHLVADLKIPAQVPTGAHVLLWYSSRLHRATTSSLEGEDCYKRATIRFVDYKSQKNACVVTKCGVRLLYIGDQEERSFLFPLSFPGSKA